MQIFGGDYREVAGQTSKTATTNNHPARRNIFSGDVSAEVHETVHRV
jgi:hypothetical protein